MTGRKITTFAEHKSNSVYGAIGSRYFRYYVPAMAEAITLTGQAMIKKAAFEVNKSVNSMLQQDIPKDYLVYIDTDAIDFELFDILDRYCPKTRSINEKTDFIDKVCKRIESNTLQPLFQKVHTELNCNKDNMAMNMDREVIAVGAEKTGTCGFWTGKKRYALLVNDMEDYRYTEPKMKIMGLASVQSSTPEICRKDIETFIKKLITEGIEEVRTFVSTVKEIFYTKSIEDVALPRSVSNVQKYVNPKTGLGWDCEWYDKESKKTRNGGVPIQSSAAINYNYMVKKFNLEKKYQLIGDGDKLKFVNLKRNPHGFKVIGFIDEFPKEFDLQDYVDYDVHFEKAFLSPCIDILEVCQLSLENKASIDDFF